MATFNDIFVSILETLSSNPNADFDKILLDKAKELGLSEKELSDIVEANKLIDSFSQKTSELNKAHKEGVTRSSFLSSEIENILKGKNDFEKEIILSSIQAASENVEDNYEIK